MSKLKGFIGETIIYGFANVFSRVFAMFLIPMYSSFFPAKTDYSNLIMLQSTFSILTLLFGLTSGVFFYYSEYENIKYRRIVFSTWFYYQLFMAAAVTLCLVVFASEIMNIYVITPENADEIYLSVLIISLQFLPYIINITNINLYRIDRKPKNVMLILFLESSFTLTIVAIGLVYFDFGIAEVLLSQVAARLLTAIFFIKKAKFYLNFKYASIKMLRKLLIFTWPFIFSGVFAWIILSIDKFIGAEVFSDKDDVAILTLAMQLTIPIVVLSDMISMALGPYVMTIRKEEDAVKSYQQIFDLSVFSALIVLIVLVTATPLAVNILTNSSYMKVIYVIPLIALGSVTYLIFIQFAMSFSLVKKTIYIMYATIIGGVIGYTINYSFMAKYGFVVSGYSQILAYGAMAIFAFVFGRKKANLKIQFYSALKMILIVVSFISVLFFQMDNILEGDYFILITSGFLCLILVTFTYLKTQKKTIQSIIKSLRKSVS